MIKWIYPYEFFVGKIYNRNIYNTISEQTMFSRTRICHKTPNPKQYDSSVSCALERVILFLNSLSLYLFSDEVLCVPRLYIYLASVLNCGPHPATGFAFSGLLCSPFRTFLFTNQYATICLAIVTNQIIVKYIVQVIIEVEAKCSRDAFVAQVKILHMSKF